MKVLDKLTRIKEVIKEEFKKENISSKDYTIYAYDLEVNCVIKNKEYLTE